MTIYYIMYAILIFIAILSRKNKAKSKIIIVITGFCLLFILLALRHWSMGVDLGYYSTGVKMGYIPSFEKLNTLSWKYILTMDQYLNYERGYIIFNKLIGSIWNNSQFFLGVCAFLGMLPIFLYIYRTSNEPLLSIIVFISLPVFLMYFSGLRQAIAISITVISSYFIEKKKKLWFILLVLLASTFHSSAIVFLIAYPMYHIRFTNVQRLILVACIPVIYILRVPIFSVLSLIFKENAEIRDTGAFTLMIVFVLIYIFLLLLNKSKDEKINANINLFYIACLCQCFGGIYDTAIRIGYYFMIYLISALPNTVYKLKFSEYKAKEQYITSYLVVLFIFGMYGLMTLSNGSWAKTNPYVFFWQM